MKKTLVDQFQLEITLTLFLICYHGPIKKAGRAVEVKKERERGMSGRFKRQ